MFYAAACFTRRQVECGIVASAGRLAFLALSADQSQRRVVAVGSRFGSFAQASSFGGQGFSVFSVLKKFREFLLLPVVLERAIDVLANLFGGWSER